MASKLNALFFLALVVAGAGLWLSSVSVPLLLLLVVPAGALLFTVAAFFVFLFAVILEKDPKSDLKETDERPNWLADASLQHSQG